MLQQLQDTVSYVSVVYPGHSEIKIFFKRKTAYTTWSRSYNVVITQTHLLTHKLHLSTVKLICKYFDNQLISLSRKNVQILSFWLLIVDIFWIL